MKIETGYLYHIKDEFFDIVNDDSLMTNHERGRKRPTYLSIIDKDILWFIPLSTKVDKYKKIINHKIERYGFCDSIIITEIMGFEQAILIQNAFPTLEKYIDHYHTFKGNKVKLPEALTKEILEKFKRMLDMKEHGTNFFFTDIDKIKKIMEDELIHN